MEEDRSSKFSPSKLDCYKECPRRYQYRYVDRISRARKTPETVLGVAAHAALEELYGRVAGGQTPPLDEVRAWFDKELDAEWDESVVARDARFTKDDWRRVGHDALGLYYSAHAPFSEDRTVAVEKRVGFPVEVEGREYRIEGFVDRLALAPDGAFEVHDYKTSKSLPGQEHADSDWQLALYELAVRLEWPDAATVRLKWHYLRHGKTLTSQRSPEARESLRAEVVALIAAIKRDHAFEPKPGPLCDWCEYRDLCPVFAHPEKVAAMGPLERKADEGVRLVDALAEVDGQRRRLKDELKVADEKRRELEERLADWALGQGLKTVAGERVQATVSVKDEVHLPTKTDEPEKHDELEAATRASALWPDVARLDAHALVDGVKKKRWAGELLTFAESLLERYGARKLTRVVRLKKRASSEEE